MKGYLKEISLTEKLYKGFRSNGRFTAFLVCLLIAIICWVFTSLNKTYSGKFIFSLQYNNLPFQKNITNELPQKISVELEARGFDLIIYSFRQHLEKIDVDVTSLTGSFNASRNNIMIPARNILTAEVTGVQPEMTVKHVTPEFITFDFSPKYRKKVPVKGDVSVTYKKQFYSPFHWILKPDSIEIAGSQDAIDKIKEVYTEPLHIFDLSRKSIIPVRVKNDLAGVEINPGKVWIYLPVDELAEGEMEVSVELTNGNLVNTLLLPDRVTIIYQAPLKLIDRINTEEFRVCADPGNEGGVSGKPGRLLLCHIPPGVYQARIEPPFVKYLTVR